MIYIILIGMTIFNTHKQNININSEMDTKVLLLNKIKSEYINYITNQEHFIPYGVGSGISGGKNKDKLNMLSFSFQSTSLVDIPTARKLMIKCSEKLLDDINKNIEMQPYLETYPFSPSSLELVLRFLPCDENNHSCDKQYVHRVYLFKGKLHYTQYDPSLDDDSTMLVETYAEAKIKSGCHPDADIQHNNESK